MQDIDVIYYTATSTDLTTGSTTQVQASYFVPFLDFFLVFIVFSFTVLILWFTHFLLYPNKQIIRIKNRIRISKKNL